MRNLALFIDGDNISPKSIDKLFNSKIFKNLSYPIIKKIYLSESNVSKISKKWLKVISEFDLDIVSCKEYKKGKNSADIKMVIDVMEDLYINNNNYFLISTDSDFVSLIKKIRSNNKTVYTAVDQFTNASSIVDYVNYCYYLDDYIDSENKTGNNKKSFKDLSFKNFIKLMHSDLRPNKDGYFRVDNIPRVAVNHVIGFNYKKLGYSKFIDYIIANKKDLIIKKIREKDSVAYFAKLKK